MEQDDVSPDPVNMEGRLAIAERYISLGKCAEAEKVLTDLLKLVPDHPWVLVKWATVVHELGRWEEAVDAVASVVAAYPEFTFAKFVLAVFCSSSDPQESERLVLEALKLEPENVAILNFYSRLLLQVGQPSKAQAILNQVIKIEPNFVDAHVSLSNVASVEGKSAQADHHAHTALGINPEESSAYHALAAEHFNRGRYVDCYRVCWEMLRMDPSNETVAALLTRSDLNARWPMIPIVFLYRRSLATRWILVLLVLGGIGAVNENLEGSQITMVVVVALLSSMSFILPMMAARCCQIWPRQPDGTTGRRDS
jgi:tetratricopeptide (TPR) repeat protein